MSGRLWWH